MVLVFRRAVFLFVLMASLFTPSAVRGADIDDLRAAEEQAIAALNRRDLNAFMALHHDQVVVFVADAPFPVVGKEALQQGTQTFFANESITLTPINPQYRIIGTTGIVWAHDMVAIKPKDGPMQTYFNRTMATYTKVDGKWLVVAVHLSAIPSGN